MSSALADEGTKAVKAGKYTEGIEKLSQALKDHPAPLWLLERSKAYLRTNELDAALQDAEMALHVAFSRANRDHMTEAQVRRAVTLYRMGRYADADICAFWAIRLVDKAKASEDDGQQNKVDENGDYIVRLKDIKDGEKADRNQQVAAAMGDNKNSRATSLKNQAISWRFQALNQLENLPAGHPGRKVNVLKYPKLTELHTINKVEESEIPDEDETEADAVPSAKDEDAKRDAWEKVWNQFSTAFGANSIRSSFYQTDTTINADFFVKNVPAERFSVTTQSQKVIMGPIANTGSDSLQLHLWGRVKLAETKYTVKSMKVELILKKETPGKWPTLQREDSEGFTNIAGNTKVAPSFQRFSALISRLGYNRPEELDLPDASTDLNAWYHALLKKLAPGLDEHEASSEIPDAAPGAASSSTNAKDATQLKSNLAQTSDSALESTPTSSKADSTKPAQAYPTSSKKGAVNWDKIGDDDGDDESKEDADVNSFFQKLYKDADDDTKRAMMKSYVESNGTSLSTNWAEAKSKTYKTQPPDGAQAKKWDE
ncbi:SGS-domain-containing protein [Daldinia sp. FL1419]|nr:SGS-domain-containing protein [Daldinia sp. FL1419]